jgi:hypothetical protein
MRTGHKSSHGYDHSSHIPYAGALPGEQRRFGKQMDTCFIGELTTEAKHPSHPRLLLKCKGKAKISFTMKKSGEIFLYESSNLILLTQRIDRTSSISRIKFGESEVLGSFLSEHSW